MGKTEYRSESKYHLITANFEEYDFNQLFNEESAYEKKIIWKIGREDGKGAQNYNIGDICYIYYSKLPDGPNRILLRAEVVESDTDRASNRDTYSYDKDKKIKGIWLSKLQAIALDDPSAFCANTLFEKYHKYNIQGQQYLGGTPDEEALISALEQYPNRKKLKAVREYFDDYTKCFFIGKDKKKHITFTSGRGLSFFEKHHFILYNHLKKLGADAKWLETERNNLIHLCPICHRQLHHGIAEDVKKMIDEIYAANEKWFEDNLQKYAEMEGYSDVKAWIYYIYNEERKKNRYALIPIW